jgi:hypothetical protein
MVGLMLFYRALVKVLDLGPALLMRHEVRKQHHINSNLSAINGQIREPFLHLPPSLYTFNRLSSLRFSRVFSHLAFSTTFPFTTLTPSSSATPFTSLTPSSPTIPSTYYFFICLTQSAFCRLFFCLRTRFLSSPSERQGRFERVPLNRGGLSSFSRSLLLLDNYLLASLSLSTISKLHFAGFCSAPP